MLWARNFDCKFVATYVKNWLRFMIPHENLLK